MVSFAFPDCVIGLYFQNICVWLRIRISLGVENHCEPLWDILLLHLMQLIKFSVNQNVNPQLRVWLPALPQA